MRSKYVLKNMLLNLNFFTLTKSIIQKNDLRNDNS